MITANLASYGAAKRELLSSVEHRQPRYLNDRAENSHHPTRQREGRMPRFKSAGHAPRFLAAHGPVTSYVCPRCYRLSALAYRQELEQRFGTWREITGLTRAA